MLDKDQIPVVDLEDLRNDDPAALSRATEALRTAFGHFGLVYIKNHGIPAGDVEAFYDVFKAFTKRDEAEKQKLAGSDIWYQRGWTPPNTEIAVASGGQPDFKECYFVAPGELDEEARLHYPQIYADNIWPEDGEGFSSDVFKRRYLELGKQLHHVGLALLRGSALSLGLHEDAFTSMTLKGPHVTRVLHYLPLKPEQVNTGILWGEEHTDFNLLTLLPGGRFYDPEGKPAGRPDDKSGLYLRTRSTPEAPNGHMVQGRPPEGCIVAQVGQMLEILTGGTFLATPHVVTAPGTPAWSRMSSAHFIHVHSNQVLFPLQPFRTKEACRDYSPPVLAGTYSIKTLYDIGLAPKTALDRLGYRQYDRLGTIRANELGKLVSLRRARPGQQCQDDRPMRARALVAWLFVWPLLTGCSSLQYLNQAAMGQRDLAFRRRPLEEAVADPQVPERTRRLLGEIAGIKAFGERQGLSPTPNYRSYVGLDRPYVVWVVSACEPLRFREKNWAFPIVGRVPYLGFFAKKDAQKEADKWRRQGWDVDVRGSVAYSTLGFFEDSVLSSMIHPDDDALGALANTVLHESLHATLYIGGQTPFNESVASFVGDELARVYLAEHLGPGSPERAAYDESEAQGVARATRLHQAYKQLDELYKSDASMEQKLAEKQHLLLALQKELRYRRPLTNATLAQFKSYEGGSEVLRKLYDACGRDPRRFVKALSPLKDATFAKPNDKDIARYVEPITAGGCR
jgi:predicted aminopeptidase/isopenicillin N synthase-like dioxygenase